MTDAQVHLGNPFFDNPTLKDFLPRIGFSLDPFGSGKTAVRAGFGIRAFRFGLIRKPDGDFPISILAKAE